MPAPTQRGEIPAALAALFALKGHTPLELDEVAVPTAIIANMTDTPYMRYSVPVIRHVGVNAVALNFGYAVISPGPTKVLQIRQIVLKTNEVAAQDVGIRIGSAAFIAQLDTLVSTAPMVDVGAPPVPRFVSSNVRVFSDVAGTDTGSSSIGSFWIPPAVSVILTYPEPGVCLYGDDEGGVPCMAIRQAALNSHFAVTVMGREWPLVGR